MECICAFSLLQVMRCPRVVFHLGTAVLVMIEAGALLGANLVWFDAGPVGISQSDPRWRPRAEEKGWPFSYAKRPAILVSTPVRQIANVLLIVANLGVAFLICGGTCWLLERFWYGSSGSKGGHVVRSPRSCDGSPVLDQRPSPPPDQPSPPPTPTDP